MKDLLGDVHAHPAEPPAAWLGGKRQLAKTLARRIGAIEHTSYVEPFVGMGGVFFRKPLVADCEVINDINGEIINLFRILQRHYPPFMDCLKFVIASREEFDRLGKVDPATLTDLERAARFLYMQRLAFGGKVTSHTFGVSPGTHGRFNVTKLKTRLADIHERLAGVVIENLPWAEVISRYDTPDTLFYLDPPYWGNETDYGHGIFSKADFRKMADLLGTIKGRFLLSLNDVPRVREIFSAFEFEEVSVTYSAGTQSGRKVREVIISDIA